MRFSVTFMECTRSLQEELIIDPFDKDAFVL